MYLGRLARDRSKFKTYSGRDEIIPTIPYADNLPGNLTAMLALLLLAAKADLYQVSTYGSLAAGNYEGKVKIAELTRHGDFGLGTFNGLDGEMVVLDGRINRINGFGDVTQPPLSTLTPFACVTTFRATKTLLFNGDYRQLTAAIDSATKDPNAMLAIRVDGKFEGLQARSFAKQTKPYRPLASILGNQSMLPYGNTGGTLVGLRMPKSAAPVNVPGYHFHYLAVDRRHGGHILGIGHISGTIQIMPLRRIVH